MKGARIVVLDACVLIPMPLADTLLRLAAGPRLYIPKWSDRIMEEVNRTLHEDFGLSPEKTLHRESEIRRHFPEAWIEGYERLIPSMTNHPKDRHVLAAAVPPVRPRLLPTTQKTSRRHRWRHTASWLRGRRRFSRTCTRRPQPRSQRRSKHRPQ